MKTVTDRAESLRTRAPRKNARRVPVPALPSSPIGTAAFGGPQAPTRAYSSSSIGNRNTAAERGTNFTYTANALNQYTNILCASVSLRFIPAFDLDGNQTLIRTSTGVWTVTYNGENRPVSWTCGVTNIVMAYDRMGRRVVCDTSVSGSLAESKRFAYDNYLLVQENDLATSNRPQATSQSFVWDPTEPVATKPLATSHQPQATSYYYVHDGNKNVSALVAAQPAQPALLASYVYAPFGAVTASSGALTTVNPFRFSSEYADDTLGLVYYNYRHYNPTDGRWTSRDPIPSKKSKFQGLESHFLNDLSKFDFLGRDVESLEDPTYRQPGQIIPESTATGMDALGVLIDLYAYYADEISARRAGLDECQSQSPYVSIPYSATVGIGPASCKCCVIVLRLTNLGNGDIAYHLERAYVEPHSDCERLKKSSWYIATREWFESHRIEYHQWR